ncbi:MAG: hypothetical protein V1856_02935 [Candidatus Liptonbacteria bacterium]
MLNGRTGQSTIEIMVALLILTSALVGAVMVIFGGQSLVIDSKEGNLALRLARENLERTIVAAKNSYFSLADSTVAEGEFTKTITVEEAGANTVKVTSRVTWQTDPIRLQEQEVSMLVTDWYNVSQTGGDTGGGGTSGDWRNPRTLGSIDLGAGLSATDLDVMNRIVYMTAEASDSKKNDFVVVDATNGEAPFVTAGIDVGSSLNALDAAGNYAYVASRSTSKQLKIIDISNISAPVMVSSTTLPGVSGSGAVGQSIFYFGNRAFIGTQKASGPEFHIMDVTNPLAPVSLGSLEINEDIYSIYVSGNVAYLGTSDDDEIRILNVSNPAAITELGRYNILGSTEDSRVAHLVGNKLYVGRTKGGDHADHHELAILDVSSSTTPVLLGSKNFITDINDLRTRDGLVFLGTSDSNQEFQVWDASDPQNIELWSFFNFPQVATAVDYENNLVYVAVRSNDALRIITSQ